MEYEKSILLQQLDKNGNIHKLFPITKTKNVYDENEQSLDKILNKKVDKVDGKTLTTNDLTNELKQDYDAAASNTHTHTNKEVLDKITIAYTKTEQDRIKALEDNVGNIGELLDIINGEVIE